MDQYLQSRMDEMRKVQASKGFFDAAPTSSPLQVVDGLRRSCQRALRELQPAGHEASQLRPAESKGKRPEVTLLGALVQPLSRDQKTDVAAGRARLI